MSSKVVEGYASESDHHPLSGYVVLSGTYHALTAAALYGLHRARRPLPERYGPFDVVLFGTAVHKLSRLIAKDKVTSFVRAPFTRYEGPGGPGEVEEEPRGEGLRYAIGELLVCPYCLGMWVATALALVTAAFPRTGRTLAFVLCTLGISDALQIAYSAAEKRML